MNKNQDRPTGEKAAGTAKLGTGLRESGAKVGLKSGPSGQTADVGNRNKRS